MFLEFDNGLWLRVHLGMYGAWDFAGDFSTALGLSSGVTDARGEDSTLSMGAPRVARMRMSEQEKVEADGDVFPPDPIGAVRVRLLTDDTVADLRGPTACDVLTGDQVQTAIDKLGPDPLNDSPKKGEQRFVEAVRKSGTPIGLLLMDQSVVSGIGNVYRAELLFRARLDPHRPGKEVPEETVRALWRDWTKLIKIGVKTGRMMTMDGLRKAEYAAALANREDRHWVYHRTGEPCRVCGTPIVMEVAAGRKLYFCPIDQV
jgi:endonuclease-8/formamidopyrimidine-DNA glycosylase